MIHSVCTKRKCVAERNENHRREQVTRLKEDICSFENVIVVAGAGSNVRELINDGNGDGR